MLFKHCAVTRLDDAALLADPALGKHDPGLESVVNVNTQEDYRAARDRTPPEVVVESHGGRTTVHAATIGAAAAVGLTLDGPVVLNGDEVAADGRLPLVAGDTVAFLGEPPGTTPS